MVLPRQLSRQATHIPEIGAADTLFLVFVAALAFGLLKDILYLLMFLRMIDIVLKANDRGGALLAGRVPPT